MEANRRQCGQLTRVSEFHEAKQDEGGRGLMEFVFLVSGFVLLVIFDWFCGMVAKELVRLK